MRLSWSPDYNQIQFFGVALGLITQALALFIVLVALGLLVAFGVAVYAAVAQGTEVDGAAIRNIGLAVAAVFGAPFLVWRSFVAQRQADIAEQGQITERINKAVGNLGATRSVKRHRISSGGFKRYEKDEHGKLDYTKPILEDFTEPNLEVRIGAIYALERLAQDSLRDHVQIMEILTAYIRENAKAEGADTFPEPDWGPLPDDATDDERKAHEEARTKRFTHSIFESKAWKWARKLKCRTDTQAALTVIGRRNAEQKAREKADIRQSDDGYRLDLRETNLQGTDLSNLDFTNALMTRARLEGANFRRAQLVGANLAGARMQGVDLGEAWMSEANLFEARLEGAYLTEARLDSADLSSARMEGAMLFKARLEGADLGGARLDQSTDFSAADTTRAALKSLDLASVPISADQVISMFGDGTVTLPDAIPRPAHWPADDLGLSDFDDEWTLWKSDPDAYIPPQDRPD